MGLMVSTIDQSVKKREKSKKTEVDFGLFAKRLYLFKKNDLPANILIVRKKPLFTRKLEKTTYFSQFNFKK